MSFLDRFTPMPGRRPGASDIQIVIRDIPTSSLRFLYILLSLVDLGEIARLVVQRLRLRPNARMDLNRQEERLRGFSLFTDDAMHNDPYFRTLYLAALEFHQDPVAIRMVFQRATQEFRRHQVEELMNQPSASMFIDMGRISNSPLSQRVRQLADERIRERFSQLPSSEVVRQIFEETFQELNPEQPSSPPGGVVSGSSGQRTGQEEFQPSDPDSLSPCLSPKETQQEGGDNNE